MTSMRFKTYYTVQALRACAAIMVVVQHSSLLMRDKLGHGLEVFYVGASGVDIFFCISGFVMIMTMHKYEGQKNGWREFISRRILRIVPLYWVLTTVKIILLFFLASIATNSKLSLWNTIGSFFFFPAWHGNDPALPIIQVGWTLNFEMFFYAMLTLVLALQKRPLIWLTYIMVILGFIGFFRTIEWGAVSSLLRPLLFEFVIGMWIAQAVSVNKILKPYIAVPAIILSIVALGITNSYPVELVEGNWRVILWGIPVATILFSMVSLEKYVRKFLQGRVVLLGDASYAIYLIQGFILTFMAVILKKIDFIPLEAQIITCIIGVIIGGIITHIYLEVPMAKKLKKVFF